MEVEVTSFSHSFEPSLISAKVEPVLVSKSRQPNLNTLFVQLPPCWIAFRSAYRAVWRWHQQQNLRLCGKDYNFEEGDLIKLDMRIALSEVTNDLRWKYYKLDRKADIRTRYVFRCLDVYNKELPGAWEVLNDWKISTDFLDRTSDEYFSEFGHSASKFEVGIQLVTRTEQASVGNYVAQLMLKRCLQIWPHLTKEQIYRGLSLTGAGQQYVGSQITDLTTQKVIYPVEQECWSVNNPDGLKPQFGELIPENGRKSARERAWEYSRR